MLKRAVVVGVIAATIVAIGSAYLVSGDQSLRNFQENGVSGLVASLDGLTTLYEKVDTAAYELEIPANWHIQPTNALVDAEFDAIISEATGGKLYDNRLYEYAEPRSLEEDFFPTSIQVYTARSILISDEYEGAMRDIMALSEGYYGIDYRVLDIRQDTLGGKPALTMEYVIVDLVDPDLPALKAIETITTGGTVTYSISYGGELDDYDTFLHHFQNAVKTFKFK